MPRRLITVTGPDRPGLIAAISRVLADEGADLEDVSMTRLEGNFAMILVCRGGQELPLRERLHKKAAEAGLHIHVENSVEHVEEIPPNAFVSAIGPNRIGIVAAISETLARHKVNIVEMATQLLEKTATPVYVVRIEAVVPGSFEPVRADLEKIAKQLEIEIRLEALEQADF